MPPALLRAAELIQTNDTPPGEVLLNEILKNKYFLPVQSQRQFKISIIRF